MSRNDNSFPFSFFFLSFFSVSLRLSLPIFYRSAYIFFRGRPRSYVANVFSRFISEILSRSNFHCDLAVRYTFPALLLLLLLPFSVLPPTSRDIALLAPLPSPFPYLSSPGLAPISFSPTLNPFLALPSSLHSVRFYLSGTASRIGRIRRILVQFRTVPTSARQ